MKRCLRRASLTQYQLEGKIHWLEMLKSDEVRVYRSGGYLLLTGSQFRCQADSF
ncbi:hypothetical protein [Nostoc sp. NMS4]|uniref:hypothetical protein n=1 Tax=Nostoc sp. NMS4 TaxID=2815390 RepID=UPI0025D92C95|nr:hypothetical protein [Nostoc sp. NMS4]MBN3922153.1 hypothetical protein [Nostoc sp. NMS4]